MLVAATATWQRAARRRRATRPARCPKVRAGRIVLAGVAVGALTGFFGVGGGFLIVPVLTLWLGFSFRRAVATSLVIITLTGKRGADEPRRDRRADRRLGDRCAVRRRPAAGALLGSLSAQRVPQAALGRAFAVVVALLALFLLADTLVLGGPPQG